MAGYRDAIDSIRRLAKSAGKKTYTMLMGKPNPAKLANFPEVEIFVMVADPQGMILDSKEYYAPIITPYEAHMAFSGDAEWNGNYSLDFSSLQVRCLLQAPCWQYLHMCQTVYRLLLSTMLGMCSRPWQ